MITLILPNVSSVTEVRAEASLSGTMLVRWLLKKNSRHEMLEVLLSWDRIEIVCFWVISVKRELWYFISFSCIVMEARFLGDTLLISQSFSMSWLDPTWIYFMFFSRMIFTCSFFMAHPVIITFWRSLKIFSSKMFLRLDIFLCDILKTNCLHSFLSEAASKNLWHTKRDRFRSS